MTRPDLSNDAKQAFQVLAFFATVLVVGIHYQSSIPTSPELAHANWNQIGQEFLFGTLARVAVPMFAFAAGLFYFRSAKGGWACYRNKTRQRFFSVIVPYLIVGLVATSVWVLVGLVEQGKRISMFTFLWTWLLHPPAEQLWFLRDLILLVTIAPLIRFMTQTRIAWLAIPVVGMTWFANVQFFPVVAGWYLLNQETLLFFMLGSAAVRFYPLIEKSGKASWSKVGTVTTLWMIVAGIRVAVRPNFDIWYTNVWSPVDLILHQSSILIGCVALIMLSFKLRSQWIINLSGASFFVYLVHEFPLRAAVDRILEKVIHPEIACWIATPLVVSGCFTAAIIICRYARQPFEWLTGGRSPTLWQSRNAKQPVQIGKRATQ